MCVVRQFWWIGLFLLLGGACQNKPEREANNGAFAKGKTEQTGSLHRIVESGELLVATISGPETYFDYQGRGLGLQYALAEDFAETQGVGVRVEICNDTLQLVEKLKAGEVDLIALQLPLETCQKYGIVAAGAKNEKKATSWAVLPGQAELQAALNDWYGSGVELAAEKKERGWMKERTIVRRKVRAPYISRERGIISTYDALFKQAAQYTGWDWKLIAAQCYQESGFDPNAVSWAGAQGLMQIMPSTAAQLGLSADRVFSPVDNVKAAARLVRKLQGLFHDIPATERYKFVLASYNGGQGHVQDARALARKYGRNPNSWSDVGYYVRQLSQPRFYRDPIVRHGYMIGDETYNYVENIVSRWRQYGGNVSSFSSDDVRRDALNGAARAAELPAEAATGGRSDNGKRKKAWVLTPEELKKQ